MFAEPSIATLLHNKAISGDELINTDTRSNIQSTIQIIDAIFHLHLIKQRDLKIETTSVLFDWYPRPRKLTLTKFCNIRSVKITLIGNFVNFFFIVHTMILHRKTLGSILKCLLDFAKYFYNVCCIYNIRPGFYLIGILSRV